MNDKYQLICQDCFSTTSSYQEWLTNDQKCIGCGSGFSFIEYKNFSEDCFNSSIASNLWIYKDLLPITNENNITTLGEGCLDIERWKSLENIAKKKFKIDIQVYVLRNDNNPGTGTFKDLAGTVISSVLSELNIKNYVVASTGNFGAAVSRYLSINDITLHAFIPKNSSASQESEIKSNGASVYRVDGDYSLAKKLAEEFAIKNNFILGGSGIDPLRIEAKKTMIYEFYRQFKISPDISIQAVSGGTGPIGVYKGSKELKEHNLIKKIPKLLLYQSTLCSPMANAYSEFINNNYSEKFLSEYEIIENPQTKITTLATGNPGLYPILSKMVHHTEGYIGSVPEDNIVDIFKFISLNETVKIGPAACISILGLFEALNNNRVKNGNKILINIGEGAKRSPEFSEVFYEDKLINSVNSLDKNQNLIKNRNESFEAILNLLK